MTTTSPATIVPLSRASIAACSRSKTRAGPEKVSMPIPAVLQTAPSGAKVPPKIEIPTSVESGFEVARKISPSGSGGFISAKFSAIVLPVTVNTSPCNILASSKALRITGTPPILSMSFITKRPKGFKSPSRGTFEPIR